MENDKKAIKKIDVKDLTPGMILGRNIENEFGGKLLLQGMILDEYKIKKINNSNHKQVYIYDEEKEKIEENINKIEKIERKYQDKKERLKSIFTGVKHGREINFDEVKNLTQEVTSIGSEEDIINLLSKVRSVDQYTYFHLLNVGLLAYMLGDWLNLDQKNLLELTQAGLLHDIGKANIPDEILNKPSKLTEEEFEKMKKHTIYGYQKVKDVDTISMAASRGILTHHERYNGTGYPLQIKGKKIPLFGRILGIVDVFDAITADRVYKSKECPFRAIEYFRDETIGAFDYELVKVFLEKIPNYFVNEEVKLNNGEKAEIIFINPKHPNKPIVKTKESFIDLFNNDDLEIKEMI